MGGRGVRFILRMWRGRLRENERVDHRQHGLEEDDRILDATKSAKKIVVDLRIKLGGPNWMRLHRKDAIGGCRSDGVHSIDRVDLGGRETAQGAAETAATGGGFRWNLWGSWHCNPVSLPVHLELE